MDTPIVKVDNLQKRFGNIVAVNGISFSIEKGETVALLGGNGAGKTTTLGMLLGLLVPSDGRLEILGTNMLQNRYSVLSRINFSSPYVDLPKRLSCYENLVVYAKLYGIIKIEQRIQDLAADLAITDFLYRPYGELSSGQRTRVSLAKSLLNKPDLLLLDEPTASLDPDTADWIRSYLKGFQKNYKTTILLASHNMAEVEQICDRVLMMKSGEIVDRDTPMALLKKYGRTNLEEVFLDINRGRKYNSNNKD
tara:strand:- start:1299 stop:2051 length:753 start_codon:yes stop_codon:yes gene_type:complete